MMTAYAGKPFPKAEPYLSLGISHWTESLAGQGMYCLFVQPNISPQSKALRVAVVREPSVRSGTSYVRTSTWGDSLCLVCEVLSGARLHFLNSQRPLPGQEPFTTIIWQSGTVCPSSILSTGKPLFSPQSLGVMSGLSIRGPHFFPLDVIGMEIINFVPENTRRILQVACGSLPSWIFWSHVMLMIDVSNL